MPEQQNLQHFDYVVAPNGARLQASAIDGMFAAALSQFASVLLASFTKGDFDLLATILITILYYAYPLTLGGQTLGKKIYGLRVLPSGDDRTLSFKEALMRETVGKTLSYITLFAGFLMILWREDRRGLHDLLSQTMVVQDAAVSERKGRILIGFMKSTAVSCTMTAVLASYFYYSSFFADRIEAQLTSQGLKIKDVSGSLAKGFLISGFEYSDENGSTNFGEIGFKFADYSKMFSAKTLTLGSVTITNAEMTSKSVTGETLILGLIASPFVSAQAYEPEAQSDPAENEIKKSSFEFEKITVKSFAISNAKISDPKKVTKIRLVQVNDFTISPRTKKISWANLNLQTDVIDLQTENLTFHKGDLELGSAISAKVHQLPGISLRQPLDIVAMLNISDGKLMSLQINALKNAVTLTAGSGSNYQLWVNSLSPSDYVDGIPLDQLNFYTSKPSPYELVTSTPQTATLVIGSARFDYRPQASSSDHLSILNSVRSLRMEAVHQSHDDIYTLKMPPGFLSTVFFGGGKIELSSSKGLPTEELLYRLGAKNPIATAKFFVSPPRAPASNDRPNY